MNMHGFGGIEKTITTTYPCTHQSFSNQNYLAKVVPKHSVNITYLMGILHVWYEGPLHVWYGGY